MQTEKRDSEKRDSEKRGSMKFRDGHLPRPLGPAGVNDLRHQIRSARLAWVHALRPRVEWFDEHGRTLNRGAWAAPCPRGGYENARLKSRKCDAPNKSQAQF